MPEKIIFFYCNSVGFRPKKQNINMRDFEQFLCFSENYRKKILIFRTNNTSYLATRTALCAKNSSPSSLSMTRSLSSDKCLKENSRRGLGGRDFLKIWPSLYLYKACILFSIILSWDPQSYKDSLLQRGNTLIIKIRIVWADHAFS